GGRVRCHFFASEDAEIGSKGYIQVQLHYGQDAAKTAMLPIEVEEKKSRTQKEPKQRADNTANQEGGRSNTIKVKVRKKDFSEVEIPVVNPVPVTPDENVWQVLGWPLDPQKVGFSIRSLGGNIQLYFNAAFPPFLEMKRRM